MIDRMEFANFFSPQIIRSSSSSQITGSTNHQITKFPNGRLPMAVRSLVVLGAFALLFCLERRRPLRRTVESSVRRTGRNLAMAGLTAVALRLTEQPMAQKLTTLVERRRWGLLRTANLPKWMDTVVALLMLDYTLYLWHVLTHRVPWLWRMHGRSPCRSGSRCVHGIAISCR